jgi:hypothetical protein
MFVVATAKTLADFMYASFTERKKQPNNEVQPTS